MGELLQLRRRRASTSATFDLAVLDAIGSAARSIGTASRAAEKSSLPTSTNLEVIQRLTAALHELRQAAATASNGTIRN